MAPATIIMVHLFKAKQKYRFPVEFFFRLAERSSLVFHSFNGLLNFVKLQRYMFCDNP